MPVHHTLEEYLDAYIAAAGTREQNDGPLFRTLSTAPGRSLSLEPMAHSDEWHMIPRPRSCKPQQPNPQQRNSLPSSATGITAYLENGGTLEHAQQASAEASACRQPRPPKVADRRWIAAHESPRTTKLCDRTTDQVSLDEIERVIIHL